MSTRSKFIATSLIFGLPAFALGRLIWPDAPGLVQPTAAQMPWFVLVALVEGLGFGIGLAFAMFGWPMVAKISGPDKKLATWTYFSFIWLLASWWPHDNLHRHIGEDVQNLLYLELGFHLTVLVATFVAAAFFWKHLRWASK